MLMKKLVRAAAPAFLMCGAVLATPGCGDDSDDKSPESYCREGYDAICRKLFNCLEAAELDAAASVIGNSAADCRTKLGSQNCNADAAKCDTGEKFVPKYAQECVEGYKDFSCDDVRGLMEGTTPDPAACELACEQE